MTMSTVNLARLVPLATECLLVNGVARVRSNAHGLLELVGNVFVQHLAAVAQLLVVVLVVCPCQASQLTEHGSRATWASLNGFVCAARCALNVHHLIAAELVLGVVPVCRIDDIRILGRQRRRGARRCERLSD